MMTNQNQLFNKIIPAPIGILVIIIVTALAGGVLFWQQQKIQKEKTKILEIKPVQKIKNKESEGKTLEENKIANWMTYKSENFAGPYEIKFPATWELKEILFSSPERKKDHGITITHFPSNYSSPQMAMKSKIEAIFIGIAYSMEKNTMLKRRKD